MSNEFKETNIKNCTYYYFDDIIKNLHPNKIMINEKSYKNILIYYIEYVTVKNLSHAKNKNCKSFTPFYQ